MNVEEQRFQQDAQTEVNERSQQLQGEFQQKLFPILNQLLEEKGLHVLLSAADAGIVSGGPGHRPDGGSRQAVRCDGPRRPPAAPAAAAQGACSAEGWRPRSETVGAHAQTKHALGRRIVNVTSDALRSALSAP